MSEIVCPVCHTRQPNAWDCAACGCALHDGPRHRAAPVQPLEGLEATRLPDANAAVVPLEGLVSTSLDGALEPRPERLEGLEATAFEPVRAPAAPALELEPTALVTEREPTIPAMTSCRYCGTPWAPGGSVFCARCGMRAGSKPAPTAEQDEGVACAGCGAAGQRRGSLCRVCGHRVR